MLAWKSFLEGRQKSGGGVSFCNEVSVINADNTLTICQMNLDGGYYVPANNMMSSAELSISLEGSSDSLAFLDALQDPSPTDNYFDGSAE